jgi:hypothetical protein
MLNSIKSKTKKILCCFALCLGILASAVSGINFSKDISVSAKSNNKIVQDVTSSLVGNGYNFNSSTSSTGKPVTPSGWTKTTDSAKNEDNIISGVVNVESETDFDTEECGTIRPSMPITDKDTEANPGYYKNLMINSTNGASRYGYKRNSSINLEDNSFYRIGVTLYTQQTEKSDTQNETDARASIYITGLVDKEHEQYSESKFENFTTLGSWEEYYFYIDTNEDVSINIELWLGSKTSSVEGAVFFNEVSVLRYSEDAYAEHIANIDKENTDDNYNFISLKTSYYTPVTNSSFEDVSMNGWTRTSLTTSSDTDQQVKSVDVNTFSHVSNDLTINTPGSNCAINNSNALFMYNKEDGYQSIESEEFTIERHTYYKLSFWAKSDCGKGSGATVKLVDTSEKNPVEASLTLSTTASSNSNTFRNDWTNYTFYICGPATASKNATIQIWLGTPDSKTSGYVFIDDFRMEIIDYSTYSANSSNSNCTSFNLNNGSDAYTITNSDFDKIENSTNTEFYPASPASWTKSGDSNTTTLSGIINTTEENFNSIAFTSVTPNKPGAIKIGASEDNNVLMIGSTAETNTQQYSSSSLSLSANSYYSVSFYVNTDYLRNNILDNYGARVRIASSDVTVFDLYNIHFADDNWHKIEVRIKTGTSSISPTIDLIFADIVGYVFFDKVELRTISSAIYENDPLKEQSTIYYNVDLSSENFDNRTHGKNLTQVNGIDTPSNWTANSTDNVTSGIISADNDFITNIPESLSGNTNYLYISSLHDSYYSYSSKQNHTFNSSTYYKIQINVLTNNIIKEDDAKEDVVYGASIALSNSSDILVKGINTEGVWKTYTIYASFTNELTTNITLALGYTDEAVRGDVFFDNLVITTIDQATYKSELAEADDLSTIATFIDYTEPEEETEEETDESTWENEVNWFIVPSLITALAIIIAIVGFYGRKINFNKKPKVKTNYDRRKTLDKDIDRREKIALRKQIIAELLAELDVIDKEIEEFNVAAEQHLDEVREQIKREQEELQKSKLEIEIRKKEATALREKQLKESPEAVQDKKAEKQYNDFIAKLDKQELSIQKKISSKEMKISNAQEANKQKVSKYLERKEYIKLQIAKIEAEIEEIARQEELLWAEYKAAKEDAKRRKAEYKAQVKAEKEKTKAQKAKTQSKSKSKEKETKKSSKTKVDK